MKLRELLHGRRAAGIGAAAALTAAVVLAIVLSGGGGHARHATTPPRTAPPTTAPAPTKTTPSPPPPTPEQLGASVNRLFNSPGYTTAQIDDQLAALARTGARIARSDALWEAAEPAAPTGTTHRFDWSFADRIAGALAAHGLRWLAIIDYSAPWAQSVPGQDHSPPAAPAAYAQYAAALAARYGPGGSFWTEHPQLPAEPVDTYEIWNEPDNPAFWVPAPDPATYDRLYVQARGAITAVQPGAHVIVGGLTHPQRFLAAMLAADPTLRGGIDGVGIHPYGRTPNQVMRSVRGARLELDSLGLGTVPLWVTELGWTTSPPGALDYLPERLRPRYIEQTISKLGHLDCGIAGVLLYTWVTPERDPTDPQDWFGISPPGGGSTADTDAFAAAIRAAQAPGPAVRACGG
jgi:hypothetical protein